MLSRCGECGGRKQIIGLGCIYKNCPTCKGIGYVEIDEIKVNEPVATKTKKEKSKPANEN